MRQLTEEYSGFRTRILCYPKQIIEERMSVDRKVHLLFIDLSKAYNIVANSKLWEAPHKTNNNHLSCTGIV